MPVGKFWKIRVRDESEGERRNLERIREALSINIDNMLFEPKRVRDDIIYANEFRAYEDEPWR